MLDMVSKFTNRLEAKFSEPGRPGQQIISASLAPKGVEREALELRRTELARAMTGASDETDTDNIRKSVAMLLGAFPTFGISDRAAQDQIRMTVHALDGLPPWAIRSAAKRFLRGEATTAWDSGRAPTPPQIRAEALQAMLPVEVELNKLAAVLDAELVDTDTTQSERDAALAHWKQIRSGIASSNVISERTGDEIAKERAEMARANERVAARTGGTASGVATEEMRRTLADILAKQGEAA